MSPSSVLRIAELTAESLIIRGEEPDITPYQQGVLSHQRACYVSIYENPGHRLQAIFGRPVPTQATLAQEVLHNTACALETHRQYHRVRKADLKTLTYSVAVLGPLERVTTEDNLEPHKFGLYIVSDLGKSAILLPQRTGIDTPQEQISTAYREAGIDARSESISMYRFSVSYFD